MDLYTTAFTFQRSFKSSTYNGLTTTPPLTSAPPADAAQDDLEWDKVQKLCNDITSREGCLVTATRELPTENDDETASPPADSTVWNVHISGGYQAVMSARGALLRELPRDIRASLKVARSDILAKPLAAVSGLKKDVKRRLDEIANESRAHIAVLNIESGSPDSKPKVLATAEPDSPQTNGTVSATPETVESTDAASTILPSYGLETERMCEVLITGSVESVEIAKVRILVMLDELSGLHSEVCDIDYKLHAIIAGRKRCVIQSIQEETATNIYFSTPLVGVLDAPRPGSQQGVGYSRMNLGFNGSTMTPQMTGLSYNGGMNGVNGIVQHQRANAAPVYNPQQHVHYPYSPQPLHMNPQTSRGMPYTGGPGVQQWHPSPMQAPLQMNPTGISNGFGGRGMNPPMSHQPMGHQQMGQPMLGMNAMGFGQNHLHVGMGAPIGGLGGMSLGPGDLNMGQFGQGPHPGLSIHSGEQGKLSMENQIWITGEFFGVQRARDMLLNVAVQKSKLVISRDTAILPRKLDWLLTEHIDDIRNILCDNGTYVQVPSVGSQASLITVFGDHRVNIERTIRGIMALACQFYVASFWLLPVSFDVLMPQATLNPAQMQPILKRISHETGAEVVFKSNCFEMHGLEQHVRAAVSLILGLDVVESFHHEIRFQIELANEHRDFISGKKNGKINKIMKMCNVRIKFETFNDYNFLIDISGQDSAAMQGLTMLQEELPAEISFHVPEGYHKRIIGVGGKNIQRIMKLYGVYVKFSNAEEFAQLGGYLDNEDNVVARTPAKNSYALENLKLSVMELVNPKDKDYTIESVSIPRRYHRTLLGEKSIFIHDIERKTNSVVRFPNKETASDMVTIFGPESQVHIAAAMILDHVPFEADLHVPPNAEVNRLVSSKDFVLFTERVKRDHQIAVAPSPRFGQGDEAFFKFRCQRSNIDFLGTARDALEEFLEENNIQVYPKSLKRPNSFADAFSHFNSKLLSTRVAAETADDSHQHRTATNMRAIFDGPSVSQYEPPPGYYDGPSQQMYRLDDSSTFGYSGFNRVPDYWRPAGQSGPVAGPSSHAEVPKHSSDSNIEEQVRSTSHRGSSTSGAPVGPISHSHNHGHSHGHTHTLSHSHGHPVRIIGGRTQSLDISHLNFARALSGGTQAGFGPMPPSPTATSSPNTASVPYFPASSGNANASLNGLYSSSVDAVTQGLANVQVSHT